MNLIPKSAAPPRGFSLIEVLLATFVLGIGLIMVATIFPVGADWTRQATEDNVAQTVARNALAVIQDAYSSNSLNTNNAVGRSSLATMTPGLQGLPNFTVAIPLSERCYQYGSNNPFPSQNPLNSVYYWTALIRPNGSGVVPLAGIGRSYDLYVLVFRKGDASQKFTTIPPTFNEITLARDQTNPTNPSGYDFHLEPAIFVGNSVVGTVSNGTIVGELPPIGAYGIGATSGTVFKQSVNSAVSPIVAVARPAIVPGERVIYAPPADGTASSALVYVYQTTVSF